MSARTCPECGGLVASTINTCPHCGHFMAGDGQPQQSAISVENPHTSIAWCIISVLLFWPLGVIAFIYYFKSDNCWEKGDQAGAERNGRASLRFAKYSVWFLIITILLGISIPFCILSFL